MSEHAHAGASAAPGVDSCELTLEPQTKAHAKAMFAVLSDPAIYKYENAPPSSVEWLRERFAGLESRQSPDGREKWLNWVIRLSSGELIGYVQATVYANGRAGIAYILSSEYWGRGFARRAVEAMIEKLDEEHHVDRLIAVLKRENVRSVRLLERLGFTPVQQASHAECEVEPGEALMARKCRLRDAVSTSHDVHDCRALQERRSASCVSPLPRPGAARRGGSALRLELGR
jgi:ribosomal-protein-alanine N-acetyltransferase